MRRAPRGGKNPTAWVAAIADSIALLQNGAMVETNILDQNDWGAHSINKKGRLVRSIGNFIVCVGVEGAAATQVDLALLWAVYIIDADDSDASLTDGSILNNNRVLQTGVAGFGIAENATVVPSSHAEIAIRWDTRVRANLEGDEILALAVQSAEDVSAVTTTLNLYGIARTLILEP